MKVALLIGFCVAALSGAALAQQRPVPDRWGPGNAVVVPGPGGGSYALGYDPRTWSYWQTVTDPRGNQYGYDTYGNYWTYNRRTNTYDHSIKEPRWDARCYTDIVDFC
jgi:hypothetical protein